MDRASDTLGPEMLSELVARASQAFEVQADGVLVIDMLGLRGGGRALDWCNIRQEFRHQGGVLLANSSSFREFGELDSAD